jgi:hypothetical protein
MSRLPLNLVVACVLALAPLPALTLLGRLGGTCGDGLCDFIPGLLILGSLAVATIVFVVRSARCREQPAVARFLPLLLWLFALASIVF